MKKLLDAKTETEVVAFIARGDDYDTIIKTLEARGIATSKSTLTNIKKRNSEALEYMQSALVASTLTHAASILRKSRELIEDKLDSQKQVREDLLKLRDDYENGSIEPKDYWWQLEAITKRLLSITELNSVAKEAFTQSQVEQGKPSAITENPAQARANLQKLLNAIAAGDDKAAIDAIFLNA